MQAFFYALKTVRIHHKPLCGSGLASENGVSFNMNVD